MKFLQVDKVRVPNTLKVIEDMKTFMHTYSGSATYYVLDEVPSRTAYDIHNICEGLLANEKS